MGTRAAAVFFSMLTIASIVAVVAITGAWLAARTGRAAPWTQLRAHLGPSALWLAWLVALVATGGSLYFSEVAGFLPCVLCWYQRIGMYPLAVVLLVAALRRDPGVAVYVWPVCALTGAISAYHVALERVPALDVGACSADVPCTLVWFTELGFVTLPVMALVAFTFIAVLLGVARSHAAHG